MDSSILAFLGNLFSGNVFGAALLVAFALVFLALGAALGSSVACLKMKNRIKAERADAAKRSRAVVGEQMAEKLSPYLEGFPADPTEARFLGTPVDFVAFSGLSRGRGVRSSLYRGKDSSLAPFWHGKKRQGRH